MFLDCFLAVKQCPKAILRKCVGYGKSPCFLRYASLSSANVDGVGSSLKVLSIESF